MYMYIRMHVGVCLMNTKYFIIISMEHFIILTFNNPLVRAPLVFTLFHR